MTASTGKVFGVKSVHDEALPPASRYGLATSVAPFGNWLLGMNSSGYVVAQAAGVPQLVSVGYSDKHEDAGTSNGVAQCIARQQVVCGFPHSTTSLDVILFSDVAIPCWSVDNQTIGKLSHTAGVSRSLLGLALGVDTDTNTAMFYPGPIGWTLGRAAHMGDFADRASWDIADSGANTATSERVIPQAKLHGRVVGIEFIGAAIAADNTDYATIEIAKRTALVPGTAVSLGTFDTRITGNGAITAWVPAAFTLSVVAGALDLLETDILTIAIVKGASGKVLTGAFRVIMKVG